MDQSVCLKNKANMRVHTLKSWAEAHVTNYSESLWRCYKLRHVTKWDMFVFMKLQILNYKVSVSIMPHSIQWYNFLFENIFSCFRKSYSCFRTSFSVLECHFLFSIFFSCFRTSFSCYRMAYSDLEHSRKCWKDVDL